MCILLQWDTAVKEFTSGLKCASGTRQEADLLVRRSTALVRYVCLPLGGLGRGGGKAGMLVPIRAEVCVRHTAGGRPVGQAQHSACEVSPNAFRSCIYDFGC